MPASPTGKTSIIVFIRVEHIESIFDVLDFHFPGRSSHDGNDVISHAAVLFAECRFVLRRGMYDIASLLCVYRFVRFTVFIRGARLHLHKDKGRIILVYTYKVNVRTATAPVALPDIPAFRLHIFSRTLLSPASKVIMLCHRNKVFTVVYGWAVMRLGGFTVIVRVRVIVRGKVLGGWKGNLRIIVQPPNRTIV